MLVLDIETSGLDIYGADSDFVRLVGWTTDGDTVTIGMPEFNDALVGHNLIEFDLAALIRHGHADLDLIDLAERSKLFDTLLMARLLSPPKARVRSQDRGYDLDTLGEKVVGEKKVELEQTPDKYDPDDPELRAYLEQDVRLTYKLASKFMEWTRSGRYVSPAYAKREHIISAIATTISLTGFRVDTELLDQRITEAHAERERIHGVLHEEVGLPLGAKAPLATHDGRAALREAFEELGVTDPPLTAKTERFQTSESAMREILEQHGDKPKVRELTELVIASQNVTRIYETIAKHVVNGRVHPILSPKQATGRWSSSSPNIAGIGKRGGKVVQREVFIPEPGHVLIAADLAQIDARAVAAHSQDSGYIELFAPGKDSHAEVAEQIWGDRTRRNDAKNIAHAVNYGAGPHRVVEMTRDFGSEVDLDTANEFLFRFERLFPTLARWRHAVRKEAERGKLLDNGFGRKLNVDPDRAWTCAPAFIGQSCARDLMMEGLLRLDREVMGMLRAFVHDEIVLSVPEGQVEEVSAKVKDALEMTWRGVPILTEVSVPAKNWAEVY